MTQMTFMVEEITKEIIMILMEERGMTMAEAMRSLYKSDTYSKLINPASGLFSQSTAYVYEFLKEELDR